MKPLVNEFCCLAPLRTGCLVIAFSKIITASMYMIGYFTRYHSQLYQDEENVSEEYFFHEGAQISLFGCAFNYIFSVILLIGTYQDVLIMILASALILLVYAIFSLTAGVSAFYGDEIPACIALCIYTVMQVYFSVVVYSYYIERKEEKMFWASIDETRRSELEQERIQAKDQGLPDPMKAALRKYRGPEEGEGKPKKSVKTTTENIPSPGD